MPFLRTWFRVNVLWIARSSLGFLLHFVLADSALSGDGSVLTASGSFAGPLGFLLHFFLADSLDAPMPRR
jgi:hypothetical protein